MRFDETVTEDDSEDELVRSVSKGLELFPLLLASYAPFFFSGQSLLWCAMTQCITVSLACVPCHHFCGLPSHCAFFPPMFLLPHSSLASRPPSYNASACIQIANIAVSVLNSVKHNMIFNLVEVPKTHEATGPI